MQIIQKKNSPLERKQRLSRSLLWQLQRNYYDRQGIEAWRTDNLPHLITSNPFLADAYARVVFAYLRDCHRVANEGSDAAPPVDASHPIYIIELGSGHGRFGYLFLKKFLELYEHSVFKQFPVKYVMTDFAERNLEHWRTHPRLQRFIEEGLLDFALFELEHDKELVLRNSGVRLTRETVHNPTVVIANYVFDSVPQDAFYVEKGQLFESLISVSSLQKKVDLEDPEIFSRIQLSYDHNPINDAYYDDAEWNVLLQAYRQRLPGLDFLFPTVALQCIRNFHQLSSGRMLLLSGDKGYSHDAALLNGEGLPGIAVHASFSMMVDYQIIGEYFRQHGGEALHPAHVHESLSISAFMLGHPPDGHAEVRQAYAEAIEKFGPDDLFTLRGFIESSCDQLSVDQILSFLRLSAWDFRSFWCSLPALKGQLPDFSETQRQELRAAIREVWEAYFHIGEEHDLAFQLGTLLLEMEFYADAIELLQHSIDLYGMESGTAYNMAVGYFNLRQEEKALSYINQAVELDPEFDAAKAMRIKLESSHRGVSS